MTKYNVALQKRKSILIGIVAAMLLFAISLSFILMLRDSLKNREALETTQLILSALCADHRKTLMDMTKHLPLLWPIN
jgi:uncharacterized protein YpmB